MSERDRYDAVQFLFKHGDLTYSAASDAVAKLCNNGFRIVRADLCVTRADLDAAVALAVRKAIKTILDDVGYDLDDLGHEARTKIEAIIPASGTDALARVRQEAQALVADALQRAAEWHEARVLDDLAQAKAYREDGLYDGSIEACMSDALCHRESAQAILALTDADATKPLERIRAEARREASAAIRAEAKVSPYYRGVTVVYQRGLSNGFEAAAQVVDGITQAAPYDHPAVQTEQHMHEGET